jgi:predicted phosphodiesterase
MKQFLRRLLYKPVIRLSNRFSSNPDKTRIETSLSKLYEELKQGNEKKGLILQLDGSPMIIFSDHHKGAKNGSDDFMLAEKNYLAALDYYDQKQYTLINLGDVEELWENHWFFVKKHNKPSFEAEKKFVQRNAFIKVFGNHDLFWKNDPLAGFQLKSVYDADVNVHEALLLQSEKHDLDIFLTHGHQGDSKSDANPFSAWLVSNIWAPLQAFLRINFNTPAYDAARKTQHNQMMYEWSAAQQSLLLITGHTHQPVFESLTYVERLHKKLEAAKLTNDTVKLLQLQELIRKAWGKEPPQVITNLDMQPSYFNAGCCCYSDGEITGIEISNDEICVVKWSDMKNLSPQRVVLETNSLADVAKRVRVPLFSAH